MKYDQLIVYYFSGTGNAKNAAQWMLDVADKSGVKTHLVNIDRLETIEHPEVTSKTLIGFCSPTHGFNVPPIMLKFIRKFPRLKNVDAFILNTRGGMKLSKIFLPGLSGLAQILPAVVLRLKGYNIVGMQPLDLPSNWLILHPGLRAKVVQSIYERCHEIVVKFTEVLLSGKRKYKALLSLPIDVLLLPIAIAYYFIGRFFLAKTLIATDDCDSCKKCVLQCPVEAIKMIDDRPFWRYNCESCMRCVNACPKRAIETAHTFSGVLLFFFSILLSPLIVRAFDAMGVLEWFNQSFLKGELLSLIIWFVFIGIVFLSYRMLHYLMRYKPINKFIAYTSLSKYKFWRRYKAPKQRSIMKNHKYYT